MQVKLQRRFPNFTYVWQQTEFDIIQRTTRISLHFHLQKQQKKLRHAFSYSWRLQVVLVFLFKYILGLRHIEHDH
ncbi:hypothetical protein SLE2022_354670 [Rubroshorea leprosula]